MAGEYRVRGHVMPGGEHERALVRTLDIDIITVAGETRDDPELTLPHPRAHERAFVLAPWHDVAPDAVLPGHGPVAALLPGTDSSGIRRAAGELTIPEET